MGQRNLVTYLQGTYAYQATATVQASPTPTNTAFTVGATTVPFRRGEAWLTGSQTQSCFIQTIASGAISLAYPIAAAPVAGDVLTQDLVSPVILPFTATGASDGEYADVGGDESVVVNISNTGSGICTIALEGNNDETDGPGNLMWFAIEYQSEGSATPTASVGPISVTAGPFDQSFTLVNRVRRLRARVSSATSGISLLVRALPLAV